MQTRITLNHKTGPVYINIEGATPEVASYIANRIKEIFSKPPSKEYDRKDLFDDLFKRFTN